MSPYLWGLFGDGIFTYPKLGDTTDSSTEVKGHSHGIGSGI